MPSAEASIVATATIAPSRAISTDDCPFVWIHVSVTPVQKCEANAVNKLRDTLATGNRGARCTDDSAAIGVGDYIRCTETFQCGEIGLPVDGDKRFGKPSLLG